MVSRDKKLRELLDGLVEMSSSGEVMINHLTMDSREARKGSLFVAVPGINTDGREFINHALEQNTAAILYETDGASDLPESNVPMIAVSGLREKIGVIANRFFDSPSSDLVVIGVTGTNGKTTCTQLLAQLLDAQDKRCAVIGTLGYGFLGQLASASHTTPDAIKVHSLLDRFRDDGAAYVCMEVSSHALEQGRVDGVLFDLALFTNLSRDHLDYHGTMEAYGAAKSSLFFVSSLRCAVINADDEYGQQLIKKLKRDRTELNVIGFGFDQGEVRARTFEPIKRGMNIYFETPEGDLKAQAPLLGKFNVANLMAVVAAWIGLGGKPGDLGKHLSELRPVAGRAESFGGINHQPWVVVDYAHTPDALEKILQALRPHTREKLWCVFGCGGDRDSGKRPQMGEIAERLADVVIVTDDNPRNESADSIVEEIISGMKSRPQVVHSRQEAIKTAIDEAISDDVILVAGKGHEDYQQVGSDFISYSDRETVRQLLEEAA